MVVLKGVATVAEEVGVEEEEIAAAGKAEAAEPAEWAVAVQAVQTVAAVGQESAMAEAAHLVDTVGLAMRSAAPGWACA